MEAADPPGGDAELPRRMGAQSIESPETRPGQESRSRANSIYFQVRTAAFTRIWQNGPSWRARFACRRGAECGWSDRPVASGPRAVIFVGAIIVSTSVDLPAPVEAA